MRRRQVRAVAIGLIAGQNVAQNTFLNETGYVAGNAAAAAILVALGKSTGLSLADMGLTPRLDGRDGKLIGGLATILAVSTLVAATHPATRVWLRDERAKDASAQSILHNVMIRFPLGTALFEEIAFRGVLPRLLADSERAGHLLSSALFGLWHVLPTSRVMRGNPLAREATNPVRVVAGGSVATALAGHMLAGLRRRTGGIAAPWLLHSSFNIVSYVGGVIAWSLDRDREATDRV